MNEDFVSFEIAKKLKEKGFNEPCNIYYHIHDNIEDSTSSLECTGDFELKFVNSRNKYRCAAPTISQVLKWLREEKNIHIAIGYSGETKWCYVVIHLDEAYFNNPNITKKRLDSYAEAAIAGIGYVIGNLI